mmetsp:Transcript_3101/g.4838  ORF Transcript_3101/g.4838 Transcript_3101/m.4838 type:complete len:284 (+) Transcript_3101:65-916(+)
MPYATGQSGQPLGRGGERGEVKPQQSRPAQHADHQFEGFFRGLGATSKQPTCSKRASTLGRLHNATHFAVGCHKWDEGARGPSTTHTTFTDPQVVYGTFDAPDKNMSVVELRQCNHEPKVHYRTEQRERFEDPGPQPRDKSMKALVSVFLGDDRPVLENQSRATHRWDEEENQRQAALRAAGAGVLIPTNPWPKPVRCNPITGGPRSTDVYDLGVDNRIRFDRVTQNSSSILMEAHVRNPIMGYHVPFSDYGAAPGMRTTMKLVDDVNAGVPPLRSLGALRPG